MLVEALVAQAAIEALDEAILLRLPRRDVVPFDAVLLLSGEDGVPRAICGGRPADGRHLRFVQPRAVR